MQNNFKDVQTDKSFKILFNKIQDFEEGTSEFIKTAQINYEELSELPDTAFAWPEMRKLAMHTKEHAALSLIYAHGEDLPQHVTDKLEKAAALYDISLNEKPLSKTASSKETSFITDDYMLPEQKMCKIASVNDIELGVEFLKRNSKNLDVMSLAHANKVLCKKASENDVTLPIRAHQEAGLVLCNLEKLAEWLETRSLIAKEQKHKDGYNKLASVVAPSSKEPISRESLIKVATTIAILDEASGIDKKYNRGIETPMVSVFNTEKVAEETILFGGTNVPLSNFAKVNMDVYTQVLGDDVVDEITTDGELDLDKLMDIMHTLPADLQQTLAPYVQQA
jgi:hypothetical protein